MGERIASVIRPGTSRRRIARTLTTAYDSGLLSADTYVHRVDALTESLIDPLRLLGDLGLRGQARGHADRLRKSMNAAAQWVREQFAGVEERRLLLSLDWEGGERELFVGRHENCDVVLLDPTVSRRHARLFFQDGSWFCSISDRPMARSSTASASPGPSSGPETTSSWAARS